MFISRVSRVRNSVWMTSLQCRQRLWWIEIHPDGMGYHLLTLIQLALTFGIISTCYREISFVFGDSSWFIHLLGYVNDGFYMCLGYLGMASDSSYLRSTCSKKRSGRWLASRWRITMDKADESNRAHLGAQKLRTRDPFSPTHAFFFFNLCRKLGLYGFIMVYINIRWYYQCLYIISFMYHYYIILYTTPIPPLNKEHSHP